MGRPSTGWDGGGPGGAGSIRQYTWLVVLIALLAALTAYVWSSLRPTRCEGRRAVVRERYPNLDVGNDDPGLKAERQVVIEQTQAAGVGVLLGWPRARGWPGG